MLRCCWMPCWQIVLGASFWAYRHCFPLEETGFLRGVMVAGPCWYRAWWCRLYPQYLSGSVVSRWGSENSQAIFPHRCKLLCWSTAAEFYHICTGPAWFSALGLWNRLVANLGTSVWSLLQPGQSSVMGWGCLQWVPFFSRCLDPPRHMVAPLSGKIMALVLWFFGGTFILPGVWDRWKGVICA